MKIWPVFSFVLLVHIGIIGLFLLQPGCQSRPADPDPSMTSMEERAQPSGAAVETAPQTLDSAFNAGLGSTQGEEGRQRGELSPPSRPDGMQRREPDNGGLEPVLQPVREAVPTTVANRNYTVKSGDTLSGIARRHGVALGDLLSLNGLDKRSTIYVGQELLLPEREAPAETREAEREHGAKEVEVRRGDTLTSIARRNGTTVAALRSMNNLSGDTIYVGQTLSVPSNGEGRETASPSPSPQSGTTYTVKAGDTPSAIANRYGISARELMRANDIRDPRKLYVGRELRIPGQAGEATAPPQETTPPADPSASGATSGESEPEPRRRAAPTRPQPVPEATSPEEQESPSPEEENPMSALEALENEELPFVEVEESESDGGNNGN
ncbi:MAG: LysM peptidoglycan-binding domain-containing protein [Verrucomicrobia bacterium]|jgi:LysM repeat protein|nr:LysM peptidoglycan-binding domain-containing protein [Verrucomicrobiota bacterium]